MNLVRPNPTFIGSAFPLSLMQARFSMFLKSIVFNVSLTTSRAVHYSVKFANRRCSKP